MTVHAILANQPVPDTPLRSAINGKLKYSESYATFLMDTTQTGDTVEVVAKLLEKLRHTPLFSEAGAVMNVADIGCNDGRACIDYLGRMPPGAAIDYYGMDLRKAALENARVNLRRQAGIRQISLIRGNAFNGKIRQRKPFRQRRFDVIFVSHSAYFVQQQKSVREKFKHAAFIKDISQMLSENGIAIFIHGNSFVSVRKQFGAAGARDTPALLERGAALACIDQLPVVEFASTLSFEGLDGLAWDDLKRPDLYPMHQHEPAFVSTLEKLSFIIHQDLASLAAAGSLPSYIDAIRTTLGDHRDCFPLTSCMQVVTARNCTFRAAIAGALQEIADEMPAVGLAARPRMALEH